jgi:hypothetical protein
LHTSVLGSPSCAATGQAQQSKIASTIARLGAAAFPRPTPRSASLLGNVGPPPLFPSPVCARIIRRQRRRYELREALSKRKTARTPFARAIMRIGASAVPDALDSERRVIVEL